MRTPLVASLAVLALAAGAMLSADPPAEEPRRGIAALGWLEGAWRSADEKGTVWEACYSSPEGGEIVSATKQIKGGKVTLYDFERFREVDGKVVLTPFPHGKASVDFTMADAPSRPGEPAPKRAIFVNLEHDFPQRMKYELTADGKLEITLVADKDGHHVGFKLVLVRKP
jgi:hypothetical protein